MSNPEPGWYPDPAGGGGLRRWDGRGWTEDTVASAAEIPGPAPSVPTGRHDPGVVPAPSGQWGRSAPPAPPAPPPGYATLPGVAGATAPGRRGPAGQPLAGWWRRAVGYVLDSILVTIPAVIAGVVYLVVSGAQLFDEEQARQLADSLLNGEGDPPTDTVELIRDLSDVVLPGFWWLFGIVIGTRLLFGFLNGAVLVARSGQTLGDRVVRIRKVMADRSVPGMLVASVRWLLPVLYNFSVGLVLGSLPLWASYLWPLWDKHNQTIVDKIVKTYVEPADLEPPA